MFALAPCAARGTDTSDGIRTRRRARLYLAEVLGTATTRTGTAGLQSQCSS